MRAACSGVKTVLRWRCGGVEAFCLRVGAVQGRREHAVKAAWGRRCGGVAAVWGRPSGGVEAAFQQRSRSRLSTRRRPDGHPAPAGRCTRDTLGLAPPICDRLHGYRYRPATAEPLGGALAVIHGPRRRSPWPPVLILRLRRPSFSKPGRLRPGSRIRGRIQVASAITRQQN